MGSSPEISRWTCRRTPTQHRLNSEQVVVVIKLQLAGVADAPAILALTRAAYAKWVPLIGREPWPMTADYAAAVSAHRIDLLYDGTALVGLIETIRAPDHVLVENLAVAPAHQGRGHARRLMAHAEQLAAGLGEIRLYTNSRFATNIALYQRLGFEISHIDTVRVGEITHMRKQIFFP